MSAAPRRDQLSDWTFGGLIRKRLPFATISNTGPVLHALIPPETLDGMRVTTPYQQRTDSIAVFGETRWPLTEAIELTTGLRYTQEHKQADVSRSRSGGNPQASPLASPLALTDNLVPLGELIGIDLSGVTFSGLLDELVGGEFQRSNDVDEANVSGRLALSASLSERQVLYASAARGYKSGGINLGVTSDTIQPTFKPEIATVFEVGSKGQYFDRRYRYQSRSITARFATIRR